VAELFVGLISGTSADGVDATLVEFERSSRPGQRVLAALTEPFPSELRLELLEFMHGTYRADPVDQLLRLDRLVGERFAAAALAVLARASVETAAVSAIGSHGQTLRHRPPGSTLQVGDPNLIAARLGRPVVADFRRMDIAFGGQGAPLVPAFHRAAFGDGSEARAIVNIGGIANVTLLPADGTTGGGDVGPGGALLDGWCARHTGAAFDDAGALAARGRVDGALLARLRADPFFARPLPKSTGRELFNLAWLEPALAPDAKVEDVQATLAELTVTAIADALRPAQPARVLVCGGGARNRFVMQRLASLLAPVPVATTAELGIDPDFVEAAAFAWLARETLAGRPGNAPLATGARQAVVLGGRYGPP
jgi:anhydro-N-acetylmuramic acid kinase